MVEFETALLRVGAFVGIILLLVKDSPAEAFLEAALIVSYLALFLNVDTGLEYFENYGAFDYLKLA